MNGYCCSSSNYLGISPWHCTKNGGINTLGSCCALNSDGFLTCKEKGEAADEEGQYVAEEEVIPEEVIPEEVISEDEVIPEEVISEDEVIPEEEVISEDEETNFAECTGIKSIDEVLANSNVWNEIGLTQDSSQYTWAGFCEAVKGFNDIGDRQFFLGENSSKGCKQGLSNIAALLAQSMWESGGDAPWTACDENNYTGSATASCTQRGDGARYDSLNKEEWACTVDKTSM